MSEVLTVPLFNRVQAWTAIRAQVFPYLTQALQAERRYTLQVRPEKRSDPQNRLLHASIADIAAQVEWAGAMRDAETWKRLLVAAWCRTRGHSVEILPALDGHGVDIVPARTSKLTRGEMSELQEFIHAWGSERGVKWSDMREDA